MSTLTKFLIFLTILILSGCVTAPQAPISDIEPVFVAGGKISLRTPEGNHTANFRWVQYPQSYAVEVWGPLGQGRSQLNGDTKRMVIARGNEVLAEGPPAEIMAAYLGWVVPIELFPSWLEGSGVDPSAPTIETSGWSVEFSRFEDEEGQVRPRRLDARKDQQRIVVIVRDFSQ